MTAPHPHRRCTLLAGIRVERGTMADWQALAALHYRSHHAGVIADVFRMVYDPSRPRKRPGALFGCGTFHRVTRPPGASAPGSNDAGLGEAGFILVGVIVVSRSVLSLGGRDRATGGRYRTAGMGRMATANLVNRELRVISRVVIAPNWRGLGLAGRLVAETLPQVGTPYVEAMAAMGRMHPFFERGGMTAYPQLPSRQGERLRACLEAVGIGRCDRRSAEALGRALDALAAGPARLARREICRWARSYLGAKNHRTNRPDQRRMLELVSRHLDSTPVYYLWRREDTP